MLLDSIYLLWWCLVPSLLPILGCFIEPLRILDTNPMSMFSFKSVPFGDTVLLLVKIETKHLLNAEGRSYYHGLGVALMDSWLC